MEGNRKSYLLDKAQPFGVVVEMPVHGGTPIDHGYSSKPLGPNTVIENHGANHSPSFADKGRPAPAINPFAPVNGTAK